MSVDLNNLLQYQRQFHQNLTTKSAKRTNSAKAVAQTDELFATPGEIIKRSELEYERAIQRQRETTIGTGLSKSPQRRPNNNGGGNRILITTLPSHHRQRDQHDHPPDDHQPLHQATLRSHSSWRGRSSWSSSSSGAKRCGREIRRTTGDGLVGVDGGDDVGSDPIPTPNAH